MDTRKDERKTFREKARKIDIAWFGETVDIDFEELRELMRLSTQKTLTTLDEVIRSRWTWGNRKTNLKMFRALVEINAKNTEQIINLTEFLNDYRMAILLLADEIETLKGTTKDVEGLKSKMQDILNNPMLLQVNQFIEDLRKKISEQQKTGEKFVV